MSRRPHKNDISIGKDHWIKVANLSREELARAIEIDPHLAPVIPFLEKLETECVAGCCGIDAFGLWPEKIEKAMAELGRPELETLSSGLACVESDIAGLASDTVASTRINQCFLKRVFLELLGHVRKTVESQLSKASSRVPKPNEAGSRGV